MYGFPITHFQKNILFFNVLWWGVPMLPFNGWQNVEDFEKPLRSRSEFKVHVPKWLAKYEILHVWYFLRTRTNLMYLSSSFPESSFAGLSWSNVWMETMTESRFILWWTALKCGLWTGVRCCTWWRSKREGFSFLYSPAFDWPWYVGTFNHF